MKKILDVINYHCRCFIRSLFWIFIQCKQANFKNYCVRKIRCHRLIILANGPSLAEELSKGELDMKEADICVVNDFCKSSFFYNLKPATYVLADPMYFYDELMRETERETIDLIMGVNWEMNLYVPFIVINQAKAKINNPFVTIIPYHSNSYEGWHRVRYFLFHKGLSMPKIQNVLIPCIFNGINLGYTKIELYGVDHSWTKDIIVNEKNQVCLADYHFYDLHVSANPWLKSSGEAYTMCEVLRDLAIMFEAYYVLRNYAEKNGCEIINMTYNSFIDAFQRGSYNDTN
ncbi:hypothetical protein ACRFAY_00405 [Bacteroides hominis]|jgi:hypothetical protein|uniref:hypothetical protein n=1 Tax=Bacteroides TaxID=816 RepID=UPI00164B785E|nr:MULTISPECIES: hypothetical protein [Bacteroides]MBC5615098.1 hypothetical protein [Bacteroides hominis (ex Liu et al. 2022)]MCC2235151.1 hypothetical protein [Bacteroides hominis (ex Afrizal et al. 2022)]MCM0193611.1 hypothetical protein [Bacteroides fragilis]MCM0199050.1 hypothetical protein [Bacteroides fragilis]MCM0209782.1 hypothetical protein [Bacteroides fragilis]